MTRRKNQKPNLLEGLRVGIVGAIPEPKYWGGIVDLDRVILTYVAQLSSLIMQYGGQVVHGSSPMFTPVLAEQSRANASLPGTQLKLYASQLFKDETWDAQVWAKEGNAPLKLTTKVGESGVEDMKTRNDSLTAMRMAITNDIDVLVAIGGNVEPLKGRNPGVLEALTQARWRSVPCFVVCAFGQVSHSRLLRVYSKGNLLSPDEIEFFARATPYLLDSVGRLILHLVNHRAEFVKSQASTVSAAAPPTSITDPDKFHLAPGHGEGADLGSDPVNSRTSEIFQPAASSAPPALEVMSISPEAVRMVSDRFSAVRSSMDEATEANTEELLEHPDFLS